MNKSRHWLQLSITAVVFVAAIALLCYELRKYNFQEVLASVRELSLGQLGVALGLTVLNFLVLIGYEYQAVRAIGHPLAVKRIALGSFIGTAVSLNVGALLGGTPVRIRLYASWGLSAVEIAKLMAMLAITFWVGALALAGAVFVYDPMPIPPDLHLPVDNVKPLGYVLLVVVICYMSLSLIRREPIVVGGHRFSLPSLPLTLSQILIASLDQIVAAGVMYALIPESTKITFAEFLGVYLLAVTAVLITHVPGGVGVLELIMLKLVPSNDPEGMAAALIVFRVLYYVLPLLLAVMLLGLNELWRLGHNGQASDADKGTSESGNRLPTADSSSSRRTSNLTDDL
jgi:uncharacterized membrane protein YbhN (UPF0104 family)